MPFSDSKDIASFLRATLRLADLVLCNIKICCLLEQFQCYTSAADSIQAAVKELCAALPALATPVQQAPDAERIHDWEPTPLMTAVPECTAMLARLALQAASQVAAPAGGNSPLAMRSFAILNTAWGSLIRVISQLPPKQSSQLLGDELMQATIEVALQQMQAAAAHLVAQGMGSHLRVMKFWLQCVVKLVCTFTACAATLSWQSLLRATLSFYAKSTVR